MGKKSVKRESEASKASNVAGIACGNGQGHGRGHVENLNTRIWHGERGIAPRDRSS